VPGAAAYRIVRNGETVARTSAPEYALPAPNPASLREYQVAAIGSDDDGEPLESFLSEPVRVVADPAVQILPADALGAPLASADPGFTGAGYLSLTQTEHTDLSFEVTVDEAGLYAIDVRYANGHGPINTSNKAAIRTLRVGDTDRVIVMPQRGDGVWNDWGYSNPVHVRLPQGTHTLRLVYTGLDANMNRDTNAAHLDHIRVTRL